MPGVDDVREIRPGVYQITVGRADGYLVEEQRRRAAGNIIGNFVKRHGLRGTRRVQVAETRDSSTMTYVVLSAGESGSAPAD
jgi:hypothetical protein